MTRHMCKTLDTMPMVISGINMEADTPISIDQVQHTNIGVTKDRRVIVSQIISMNKKKKNLSHLDTLVLKS